MTTLDHVRLYLLRSQKVLILILCVAAKKQCVVLSTMQNKHTVITTSNEDTSGKDNVDKVQTSATGT